MPQIDTATFFSTAFWTFILYTGGFLLLNVSAMFTFLSSMKIVTKRVTNILTFFQNFPTNRRYFKSNKLDQMRSFNLNFGPQHPSAHGVLRLVLELNGEAVCKALPPTGLFHKKAGRLVKQSSFLPPILASMLRDVIFLIINIFLVGVLSFLLVYFPILTYTLIVGVAALVSCVAVIRSWLLGGVCNRLWLRFRYTFLSIRERHWFLYSELYITFCDLQRLENAVENASQGSPERRAARAAWLEAEWRFDKTLRRLNYLELHYPELEECIKTYTELPSITNKPSSRFPNQFRKPGSP